MEGSREVPVKRMLSSWGLSLRKLMISRVRRVADLRMRILNSRGGRLETATLPSSSGSWMVKVSTMSHFLRSGRTINAYIAQGECQTTAVEDDTEALEGGFFELCPDASIRSVRSQRMELKLQLIGRIGVAQICLIWQEKVLICVIRKSEIWRDGDFSRVTCWG